MRLLVPSLLCLALTACADPGPHPPEASGADTLALDLDSLVAAEMQKRVAHARAETARDSASRRSRQRHDALWAIVEDEDWSDAPDSLLVELLHMALQPIDQRMEWRAWEPRVLPRGPRNLRAYRNGLPFSLDPYARQLDSLARRYGIAGRVQIDSRTDTLYRDGSHAGFDLYQLITTTEVRASGAARAPTTPDRELGVRQTHATLAVRGGRAQVLLLLRENWAGLSAAVHASPDGPVLGVAVQSWGARVPYEQYFEHRGGAWHFLGRDEDLWSASMPLMTSTAMRDYWVDITAMETYTTLQGPPGLIGCFVTEIERQNGRFARGRATWHREVENCHEYTFVAQPPRVEVDTSDVRILGSLTLDLTHRATRDTTTQFDWRLLDARGRTAWQGSVPRGLLPDTTFRFRTTGQDSGRWRLLQTQRTEQPAYNQIVKPPHFSVRRRSSR